MCSLREILRIPLLAAALLVGACGGGGGGSGGTGNVVTPPVQPPPETPGETPTVPTPDPPQWDSPAVVVILADDLGYGSLNSYGAYREVIRTPQIDRLAAEGVRFTQAYAPSSVCSPTRYGVLLGRYAWRTGRKVGVVNALEPLWPSTQRMNLARWLKARGYSTATIGKWHLGYGGAHHAATVADWIDNTTPGPEALGFDYSFNVPQNHGDMFGVYFENGQVVGFDQQDQLVGLRSTAQQDYGNTTYGSRFIGFDAPQRIDQRVTDQITTRAIEWMQQQVADENGPFFLYFAPVAVHDPITPSAEASGGSGAGPYGDFIHDLDTSVGRILDALDAMGIADDTVVIFSSDNGGDIPTNRDTPQRLAMRKGLDINGALRGDKHTIWEGGTRVPLLVRMPGADHAPVGSVSDALVNLTDIFATVADLVGGGAALPAGAGPDSVSFLPSLRAGGTASARTSTVTANVNGIVAIRSGDWKWIEGVLPVGFQGDSPADESKPQLYNLRDDPGETADVRKGHPDIVERLRQELENIRAAD